MDRRQAGGTETVDSPAFGASRGLMVEKKSRSACDGRLSEANSKSEHARYSAFALQSQLIIDALRVRRLMRAGLPIALAVTFAPLVWGRA
jgi:hypothetical protein